MSEFRLIALKELTAGRNIIEKVTDGKGAANGAYACLLALYLRSLYGYLGTGVGIGRTGTQLHFSHSGY